MKLEAPCYGCDNREVGCHAKCEKYREFQGRLKMEKDKFEDYRSLLDYNSRKHTILKKRKRERR